MQLIISPLWTVIVTVLHLAVGQVEALVEGGEPVSMGFLRRDVLM